MIQPEWRRVAGLQVQDDGTMAAVWLAHDKDADTVHLYDSAIFRREVLAVVVEGITARGRWIPLAWHKEAEEIVSKLLERGCNTLYEPVVSSQAAIEAASRDIWERMRTHRFKVDKRLGEWLDEYRTYYRENSQVPKDTHPLMAATRHAVESLPYARRQSTRRKGQTNSPSIAII